MRKKRSIYDVSYHYEQEIGCCEYCDEKSTHLLLYGHFSGRGWKLLCKKHYHEWTKGELYV